MSELETLKTKIEKLEADLKAINDQLAPLEKKRDRMYASRSKLQEKMNELKADDLEYVLNTVGAYEQFIAMLPKQTYSNGYWAEYHEQSFKLMFTEGEAPKQDLIDFLDRWRKVAKYLAMGVFRHDCGEDGHWEVFQSDAATDTWAVRESRWGRYTGRDPEFTGTLDEVLQYVSKNHYYRSAD